MSLVTQTWKYCPVCRRKLGTKRVEGRDKLSCPKDHFIFYDNPLPVVAALIVAGNGLVLVKRGVDPFVGRWCMPRGYIDTDEKPKQAIAREVREETGLYIWLKRILCSTNPSPENFPLNQISLMYLATIRGGELKAGSDCLEAGVFPFDQLPDLCFDTDKEIIRQWRAGSHGTVDVPVNFPQRSTLLLPGERLENGRVVSVCSIAEQPAGSFAGSN
jgi:8-oxo-dGTP diphosphatase